MQLSLWISWQEQEQASLISVCARGKVESVEDGLHISFNTGRVRTLEGKGDLFGPFEAPKGFYVDGLRVKPLDGKGNEKVHETWRRLQAEDIMRYWNM